MGVGLLCSRWFQCQHLPKSVVVIQIKAELILHVYEELFEPSCGFLYIAYRIWKTT